MELSLSVLSPGPSILVSGKAKKIRRSVNSAVLKIWKRLALDEDFFALGINDRKPFPVHAGIASEDEAPCVRAFKFHEELGVFGFEAIEDVGIDGDD